MQFINNYPPLPARQETETRLRQEGEEKDGVKDSKQDPTGALAGTKFFLCPLCLICSEKTLSPRPSLSSKEQA